MFASILRTRKHFFLRENGCLKGYENVELLHSNRKKEYPRIAFGFVFECFRDVLAHWKLKQIYAERFGRLRRSHAYKLVPSEVNLRHTLKFC